MRMRQRRRSWPCNSCPKRRLIITTIITIATVIITMIITIIIVIIIITIIIITIISLRVQSLGILSLGVKGSRFWGCSRVRGFQGLGVQDFGANVLGFPFRCPSRFATISCPETCLNPETPTLKA